MWIASPPNAFIINDILVGIVAGLFLGVHAVLKSRRPTPSDVVAFAVGAGFMGMRRRCDGRGRDLHRFADSASAACASRAGNVSPGRDRVAGRAPSSRDAIDDAEAALGTLDTARVKRVTRSRRRSRR